VQSLSRWHGFRILARPEANRGTEALPAVEATTISTAKCFCVGKDVLTLLPAATDWSIGELTPGAWAAAPGSFVAAVV
jgi:hypothetical protein